MRKRNSRQFVFDSLEDRKLMTAGFKPDVADVVMYGMMGFPPMVPPPPTGKPGIVISGGSQASIGGSAAAFVTPGISNQGFTNVWSMKKIVYEASGALSAQVAIGYTSPTVVATGGVIQFDTITHDLSASPQTSDSGNWFWNESAGTKIVQVTVTYNDPASTVLVGTATQVTTAPVIAATTLSGKPALMRQYPDVTGYALTYRQTDGSYGIQFKSTINSAPSGGNFGFIQIATQLNTTVESKSKIIKTRTPEGAQYIDDRPGGDSELMGHWSSPNGVFPFVMNNYDDSDSPSRIVDLGLPGDEWPYSIDLDFKFDTYLVWKPSGGVYIAVDHIAWAIHATATYNGTQVTPAMYSAYTNSANWTVTQNHSSAWTQTGDKQVSILNWYDNATTVTQTPPVRIEILK